METKTPEMNKEYSKFLFSEIFYHKNSAFRISLTTYKNNLRLKIELIPAMKDESGNIKLSTNGKSTFDYKNSLNMVFSGLEFLRIKKSIENILNPQKRFPEEIEKSGYIIEHFFETPEKEKKKSVFSLRRVENNYKPKNPSPFEYKYAVMTTLYSSLKNTNISFVFSEEESYFLLNILPAFVIEYMKETGRNQENKQKVASKMEPQTEPKAEPKATHQSSNNEDTAASKSQSNKDISDAIEFSDGMDDIPF